MGQFGIKFTIMVWETQLSNIDDDDAYNQTVVLVYVTTYI